MRAVVADCVVGAPTLTVDSLHAVIVIVSDIPIAGRAVIVVVAVGRVVCHRSSVPESVGDVNRAAMSMSGHH